MQSPMTYAGRVELANAIRDRYANARGNEKQAVLEEFVAATGYQNVWPAPSARGILKCSDQSALTYAVSWGTPWPSWTSARLEPQ